MRQDHDEPRDHAGKAQFIRNFGLMLAVTWAIMTGGHIFSGIPAMAEGGGREEFRQTLVTDSQTINRFLEQTRQGKNVSEFSLGWVAYSILVEISAQDKELYDYFNKDGKDVQIYLRTTFEQDPGGEITKIEVMSKQGHPTLRSIARYTLESLRHIPTKEESPAIQEQKRNELANTLATLKAYLEKGAEEAAHS